MAAAIPPEIVGAPDAWIIDPSGNSAYYRWYRDTFEALQDARATWFQTHSCPNCRATRTVTVTPRSIACSACGWAIDLRGVASFAPRERAARLREELERVRGMLYTLKPDIAYRGMDLFLNFETLSKVRETIEARIKTLEENDRAPFLLQKLAAASETPADIAKTATEGRVAVP